MAINATLQPRARLQAALDSRTPTPGYRQRLAQQGRGVRAADPMADRTAERRGGYGGIKNEWTDELTNAMFSQQRDQLAEQYGHVERELHRQLTLGQVTPAQYSAELRHLKTRRAGATAASMRDIKIQEIMNKQNLATRSAELRASVMGGGGGAKVMGGGKKDEPMGAKGAAAAWAKAQGFGKAGEVRLGDLAGAPGGVQNTFQQWRNTTTQGRKVRDQSIRRQISSDMPWDR